MKTVLIKNFIPTLLCLVLIPCISIAMDTQEQNYIKIRDAISNNDIDVFTKYMESYQDVNYIANDGYGIPHYGFTKGITIMDLMLKYQPDINIKSTLGMTPLMCAVYNSINKLGNLQNVAFLLEAGANLDAKSGYLNNKTAFEHILDPMSHPVAFELAHLFLDFLEKKCIKLEKELEEKNWIEEKLLFRHNSFAKLFANQSFLQTRNLQYNDGDKNFVKAQQLQESEDAFAENWTAEHKALWPLVQNAFAFSTK